VQRGRTSEASSKKNVKVEINGKCLFERDLCGGGKRTIPEKKKMRAIDHACVPRAERIKWFESEVLRQRAVAA